MRDFRPPQRTRDLIPNLGRRLGTSGYNRLHRGLWIPHGIDETDPMVRIAAISALCPDAVVTGWLAAEAHGHRGAPRDYIDEFACGTRRVDRPGMIGRQYTIPREHTGTLTFGPDRLGRIASPAWALFDIARRDDPTNAVIALDGSPRIGVDPERDVRPLAETPRRLPGKRRALAALELCDTGAMDSPWETRTRLFLHKHGFEGFETQVSIPGLPYRLDLGNRRLKIAVEYDGEYHRAPDQHARDLTRWNRIRKFGWLHYPVTTTMITRDEHQTAADIRQGIRAREGDPPGSTG